MISDLRMAFRKVRNRYPFSIEAICVLPDHLHTIWTFPDDQLDYSLRWRLIKSNFSKTQAINENRSVSRVQRGERGIWQRRFREHMIRDQDDFRWHMDYTYFNPVRHHHVGSVKEWSHSSFHRDVRRNFYPENWAGRLDIEGKFGE